MTLCRGSARTRNTGDDDVEFCTILTFDDQAAERAFVGPDHTAAVHPPAALRLLSSYAPESLHCDLVAHHEHPDR